MIRVVVVLVVIVTILRRITRGKSPLGPIATVALGIAGAVIGGTLGEALGGGSDQVQDLITGLAAASGAVAFVAVGEVRARRRHRPVRR